MYVSVLFLYNYLTVFMYSFTLYIHLISLIVDQANFLFVELTNEWLDCIFPTSY